MSRWAKATVIPFEQASPEVQELARTSLKAREKAYCPFSNFPVGAVVVTDAGEQFLGCNVENSSYGMTSCAEQTAIGKAISEGSIAGNSNHKITTIMVSGNSSDGFTTPCGRCRQVIFEFGSEIVIYCVKPDLKEIFVSSIDELLPFGFRL